MARMQAPQGTTWLFIGLVLVIGLYAFGQFTSQGECTAAMVALEKADEAGGNGCVNVGDKYTEFVRPADVNKVTKNFLNILIYGVFIVFAYLVVMSLSGGGASFRKHGIMIIIVGVMVWFIWDNFLRVILQADTISEIAFSVAKKLGMIK